ncbi:MAG TPA: hypothetical protein VIG64_05910 [Actinomycetota bacterium]|jgi:hypothetical protein
MARIIRSGIAIGAFLIFSIPGLAAADPCPETELARIKCPTGTERILVCQDHHGVITVHVHCKIA